jgi:hypothetical protein
VLSSNCAAAASNSARISAIDFPADEAGGGDHRPALVVVHESGCLQAIAHPAA